MRKCYYYDVKWKYKISSLHNCRNYMHIWTKKQRKNWGDRVMGIIFSFFYIFWYQFLLFASIVYFCPTPKKEKELRPLEFASLAPLLTLVSTFQSVFSGKDMTILNWKQTPDEPSSIPLPVGGKWWKQVLKDQINPALALRPVNNRVGGRELRWWASEFQDCLQQAHLK